MAAGVAALTCFVAVGPIAAAVDRTTVTGAVVVVLFCFFFLLPLLMC